MLNDVREKEKANEQNQVRYNTYEERKSMNVVAFVLTIVALVVLCCMPFDLYYGKPVCYIAYEDGKLMLAILLTMAFFYFLSFDMLAFCISSVNAAFLAINTYQRILYESSELLGGFYVLWLCSLAILVMHFLYPYLRKKLKKK